MTNMQHRDDRGRVFYADWGVQEFRGIERFSDYRKIKARLQRNGIVPGARRSKRRIRFPDHRLNFIIAISGVIAAACAVVALVVALR